MMQDLTFSHVGVNCCASCQIVSRFLSQGGSVVGPEYNGAVSLSEGQKDGKATPWRRHENDAMKRILEDMLKIVLDPAVELPTFFAIELSRLPQLVSSTAMYLLSWMNFMLWEVKFVWWRSWGVKLMRCARRSLYYVSHSLLHSWLLLRPGQTCLTALAHLDREELWQPWMVGSMCQSCRLMRS